ncbi:phage tail sheath C-terminal domain-containing protein [Shewanella sp. YLB-07]|uniref:phage tail sheath C-terminal domain-containing protein n=1 Tax=Shewanella sp. YLB-07 TaxID=2601268 RepID=UPI00128CBB8E|nr:phage tail sheath C-terminal domain-containing protein [Shewanella sp. YLB-07]MPY24387.1 phage tail sheath family protein [Shewanella sp. YLB-07]
MNSQQPGVSVTEEMLSVQKAAVASAVPLFIGYTEKQPVGAFSDIANFSDYEAMFGNADGGNATLYYTVKHFFDNGGLGGFIFSLGKGIEFDVNQSEEMITDLQTPALRQMINTEQSITLLSFPDIVRLPDLNTNSVVLLWQQAWQQVLGLCQVRPGLFAVLDSPDDPQLAERCLTQFSCNDKESGSAYWPRLVTPYMDGQEVVMVPASGAVIAGIQKVDSVKGVWSAPANIALSHVTRPSQSHQNASGLFNPQAASFNLIRSFPGRGTRIWGCRTFTDDDHSSFRYVQVRRLISYCETQLSSLGRMFVFEPNNEITWYKLKGLVHNWLQQLWQQGGLYGMQEEEAFAVLLGLHETMTPEDILDGKMIMNVRLSVLAPAEFIDLNLRFDMNADGNT